MAAATAFPVEECYKRDGPTVVILLFPHWKPTCTGMVCLAEWQCLKCFEAPGIMLKECLREEQEGITLLTGHQAILSLPITAGHTYVRT